MHISQYEFHSNQAILSAHHKPQPDSMQAVSRVSLDRLRPNFIRCQPTCAAPHGRSAAHGCTCCRRHAESTFCAPSVRSRECWQGYALDVFPPGAKACSLSIHVWPVRPFLARFLCSLMRATKSNQPSSRDSRLLGPRALALSPFSLGAELLRVEGRKRDGWAGWARW